LDMRDIVSTSRKMSTKPGQAHPYRALPNLHMNPAAFSFCGIIRAFGRRG